MSNAEPETEDPEDGDNRKSRWWVWLLGFFLLLALCDDDDDRPRRYCYTFGEERLCFDEPLPSDKFCYLEADGIVTCYDEEL